MLRDRFTWTAFPSWKEIVMNDHREKNRNLRKANVLSARGVFPPSNVIITGRSVSRLWIADWQRVVRHDRCGDARAAPRRRTRCNPGLTTPAAGEEERSRPRNYGASCCNNTLACNIYCARASLLSSYNLFLVFFLTRARDIYIESAR